MECPVLKCLLSALLKKSLESQVALLPGLDQSLEHTLLLI